MTTRRTLSRRQFLALGSAATAGLVVAAAPSIGGRRRPPTHVLTAGVAELEVGDRTVRTWAYDGRLPGPELRLRAGHPVSVQLRNSLQEETTVHWHGIRLRNGMDGVPGLTQRAVPPGSGFRYEFVAPDAGTYFYHSHVGAQLDRGLYGPLIVDDPAEKGDYDDEYVVVLDDWSDGMRRRPLEAAPSPYLRGPGGQSAYPAYLLNGHVAGRPQVKRLRASQRIRLRIINAASDTVFRIGLAGHRLTVTHTDGFPVVPHDAACIVIGMGERYDATVTLHDGAFALDAIPEGKPGSARALLTTEPAKMRASHAVRELRSAPLDPSALKSSPEVALPAGKPDAVHRLELVGERGDYALTVDGRPGEESVIPVEYGQRLRFRVTNRSDQAHPIHLHGHTLQLISAQGTGARKDTLLVRPRETVFGDFLADNVGDWVVHCHNVYHHLSGMMTLLSYRGARAHRH